MAPDVDRFVVAILNDWYMVRHYRRGARSSIGRELRQQAIQKLGLTIREAFNRSDNFEPLIVAVVMGARPQEYEPPF